MQTFFAPQKAAQSSQLKHSYAQQLNLQKERSVISALRQQQWDAANDFIKLVNLAATPDKKL